MSIATVACSQTDLFGPRLFDARPTKPTTQGVAGFTETLPLVHQLPPSLAERLNTFVRFFPTMPPSSQPDNQVDVPAGLGSRRKSIYLFYWSV
jgi:hypothetical protein